MLNMNMFWWTLPDTWMQVCDGDGDGGGDGDGHGDDFVALFVFVWLLGWWYPKYV